VTWRLIRGQSPLTPDERTCVAGILKRASEFGCRIDAAVVMDDHVHVLFGPGKQLTSARFVSAWKSAAAHRIVKSHSRTAPIWQPEYYQRWLASSSLIPICASYIRDNPRRKWPGIGDYPWLLP
jgi:REP element-mobilizing transposase RayT